MESSQNTEASQTGSLKTRSYELTGEKGTDSWVKRTAARGFAHMSGWKADDFSKPVITVAAPFAGEANICNQVYPRAHSYARSSSLVVMQHFQLLAEAIADEIEKCGGKAYLCFPPVSGMLVLRALRQKVFQVITDGMTMGSEGMKYSLPSRDLVANCIELMHEGLKETG